MLNSFLLLLQIDVESVEKPLYYSSGDETDTDCLYYLPVAPEIDEPEGDLTHGYDTTGKPPGGNDKIGAGESADGGAGEKTNDGPPAKKTKTKDIDINGDAYDANAISSGKLVLVFSFYSGIFRLISRISDKNGQVLFFFGRVF